VWVGAVSQKNWKNVIRERGSERALGYCQWARKPGMDGKGSYKDFGKLI
jgi:hypothetical protein